MHDTVATNGDPLDLDYFRKIEAWRAWLSAVPFTTDLVNPPLGVR